MKSCGRTGGRRKKFPKPRACLFMYGDFHLSVTEDWARLTSIERATVSAEAVNAAEDPDGLIGAEIAKLVAAAHISYEAKEKPPAPGADNTAQVAE